MVSAVSVISTSLGANEFFCEASLPSQQPLGFQFIDSVESAVVAPSWNASTVVGLTNWQATELPPTEKVNCEEPLAVAFADIELALKTTSIVPMLLGNAGLNANVMVPLYEYPAPVGAAVT
jgi:hypothetical protein